MNNALDTRHPLQRLADRLRLVAIHQDSTDLLACLAGKGMPSLSREGDEPAELIWESLSRYLQPDKAMLDLFADTLAQASRKFLEKLAELMAQTHVVAVNEGLTASAGVPDAGWQEYEPLAFNLTLLASYLPAHPNLFNAMQACYEEGLNLGSILGGRVPKSLHNALVMQQTDNRYAKRWFDELITLVQNSVSLVHSAQRVQAMQAWQALLLVPDEIDSIQHTSSLSHRALVAAMGDDFENDPNRQRLVRQMLERISKIHVGGDFVWREYFSAAHGWHTLLVAFAEDIWLEENDPDRLLDTQNHVTWRTGLSLTQRQRIRQSYTRADKHNWDLAWDDVFRTSSAPREKLMALRTQLNNTKPELSKTHRPTKQDFRHLQEEAKMAPALSKPPKGVIDYSQPTSADQHESVQKALQDIEKQLRKGHESVAVKRADELIKQQQKRQAKAELIAKTASSVATLFAKAGYLTRAQAWWQQAKQSNPHDVVARCGLADTLKAQDKLVEAEVLYRETMSQFPDNVVVCCGLAGTLKARDKLAEAEALYNETMSQFPHDVVSRNGLADTLKAQDKLAEAEALYRETMSQFPHDVVARCGLADTLKAQDKLAEAEVLYRETMSQFPHDVVARCGLAETLKAQDKLAEAGALYRETMSQFPHAVVARCGLAETLKAQDKLAEAGALYRETMSQFPHDVVARCGLAETLKAQDKLADAGALYRETMSQFPHAVVARNGLAETLKAQDKLAEAEALYRETMSQFPQDVVARCGLADTLKAQDKLAEAEALYRETKSQFPHAVVARCGLAETLKAQAKLAEAEVLYRETMSQFPHAVVARNGLADTLKAQAKLAEAEVLYRETMSQFPHAVVARNGLANVLRKQKRYAEALECLPKPSDRNDFLDQVVLTLIEADRGQFDAAIQRLNDLLIAPCSKEADKQRLLALLTSVQIRAGRHQQAWETTQNLIKKCRYASQNLIVIHSAWVAGKELDVEARIKQFPPQSGLEKMVWKLLQKCRENSLATSDDELFEKECDMLLAV